MKNHQPVSILLKKLPGNNQSVVKVRLTNNATMTVNKGKTPEMVNFALVFAKQHSLKFEAPG